MLQSALDSGIIWAIAGFAFLLGYLIRGGIERSGVKIALEVYRRRIVVYPDNWRALDRGIYWHRSCEDCV